MENELTKKVAEFKRLAALRGGEALKVHYYFDQLCHDLTPMLIERVEELNSACTVYATEVAFARRTVDEIQCEVDRLTLLVDTLKMSPDWVDELAKVRAELAVRDAEIKRMNADLTDALNSRDHFGTLWDALREDLEDERAGRPLLAKATDRIAQLENDLAEENAYHANYEHLLAEAEEEVKALKSGMYLETLQLVNEQMAKTIDILRGKNPVVLLPTITKYIWLLSS